MKTLMLMATCLVLFGCSGSRKMQNIPSLTFWKIQHDTVYIPRDTTFVLPPDSCLIQALIECDSTGIARISSILKLQTGKRILQRLDLTNNLLQVSARVDTALIIARWMEKQISVKEEKIVTVEKQVNIVKGYQWFFIYCGYLFCIVTVGWLLYSFVILFLKKITL